MAMADGEVGCLARCCMRRCVQAALSPALKMAAVLNKGNACRVDGSAHPGRLARSSTAFFNLL